MELAKEINGPANECRKMKNLSSFRRGKK